MSKRTQAERDLLDGYASHVFESYARRYGEAVDLLAEIIREAQTEAWAEGAEKMAEWFTSGDHSRGIDPPKNDYEDES